MIDSEEGRLRIGSVLAGAAGIGFVLMAALHATGFAAVAAEAEQAPQILQLFGPVLWLAYSLALAILGLVAGAIAFRPSPVGRFVLGFAACFPIGSAVLQVLFVGLIPHTLILLAVGGVAAVAAIVIPGEEIYDD